MRETPEHPYDHEPCGHEPYDYDAVVLAGGGARRLGGADKPAVTVGGRTLLDRVLSACAGAARTVVVGPRRPAYRPVEWVREDPPGGGPLAALDAGLRGTTADTVLVLSADLPFLGTGTVRELLGAERDGAGSEDSSADGFEGAVLCDAQGRDQPLVAAYGAEALRRELALLRTEYGSLGGLPLRLLLPELRLRRITVGAPGAGAGPSAALDCDTWDDIAAARARIREHGTVLDEWTAAVKAELGIEDLEFDTAALLDLARDAAHGVARPAAPLTTFLAGYAAARRGGSPEDVAECARIAARLAERWAAEGAEGEGPGDGAAPRGDEGKGTDSGR
ncbi:NTP transferase domain-containing protein [Streptomyces sp. ODS28]|uniref:NTP transferase domain-containing protein n=1 Tax=Streptomyces sp. ODS28 TaxID=3136688 RepID=UPI0031EFB971